MLNLPFSVVAWIAVGVLLLAVEIFTTTFYLLFFSIAAFLTAGLAFAMPDHRTYQIVAYAVLAVLGVFPARHFHSRHKKVRTPGFEIDRNQMITLSEDLVARGQGTLHYQGVPWTAINESERDFKKGEVGRILRTQGNRIYIGET